MANRRRGSKKIDILRWQRFTSGTSFFAQAAGSIGLTVATATNFPETVMRTRGSLVSYIDGTSASGKSLEVGVGMAIVPEGLTGVPWEPLSDPDAPWFLYTTFFLGYEEMVNDAVASPGLNVYRETIDSKAMRIARPDQEIELVVEQATVGTASSINTYISGRFLLGR